MIYFNAVTKKNVYEINYLNIIIKLALMIYSNAVKNIFFIK